MSELVARVKLLLYTGVKTKSWQTWALFKDCFLDESFVSYKVLYSFITSWKNSKACFLEHLCFKELHLGPIAYHTKMCRALVSAVLDFRGKHPLLTAVPESLMQAQISGGQPLAAS